MRKSVIVAAIVLGMAGVGIVAGDTVGVGWLARQLGFGVAQGPQAARSSGPALGIPVEVARARAAVATADIRSVGSLQSDESVQMASEVAGRVAAILFKEGDEVKAGAVLVKLDDSLAVAELTEAEARRDLAEANFERTSQLARSGNTTARARDEATSARDTARAVVELVKARIAKLSIVAPFSGRIGLRKVSVGAYVQPGAVLVNLEKIDELKVDFKIPEMHLAKVKVGQAVEVTVDALPDRTFEGAIYAIDPMVDVNGRALSIRARLRNADLALRPGLFARIMIKGLTERKVAVVPEQAIAPRGQEVFVYRVEDGRAIETKVRLGARRAGEVEIVAGLEPDTLVVTAGQLRLRNNAKVDVVTPAAEAQR